MKFTSAALSSLVLLSTVFNSRSTRTFSSRLSSSSFASAESVPPPRRLFVVEEPEEDQHDAQEEETRNLKKKKQPKAPKTPKASKTPKAPKGGVLTAAPSTPSSSQPSNGPTNSSQPSVSSMPTVVPWKKLGADIDGDSKYYYTGSSVSLSTDGTIMAIGSYGAEYYSSGGFYSGIVRVYEWNDTTSSWDQKGPDIGNAQVGENFGKSVSLSSDGTIVAIGAPSNDADGSNSGAARVFQWNDTFSYWQQVGSDFTGAADNDYFGSSVSLSSDGTVVAIGATQNDDGCPDAGHVQVYEWMAGAWEQKGADIDGELAFDKSGTSIALSGDASVVVIGAPYGGGFGAKGKVRVYEWDGDSWEKKGLDIDGEGANDAFGRTVSISTNGSIIAVGGWANDDNGADSGHVRVYEWDGDSWEQMGADIDGEATSDYSGTSVSLSSGGTIIAIGSSNSSSSNGDYAGSVRLFEWNDSTSSWEQKGTVIDGEALCDWSGDQVALSGDGSIVAIGAYGNDGDNDNDYYQSGHVRVYKYIH